MGSELQEAQVKVQREWLKFMLERVGNNNLPRLLDYYESIGWISADVADSLLKLAEKEKQRYEGPTWTLSPQEHRISMLYIKKMMGKEVNDSLLSLTGPHNARFESPVRRERGPTQGYVASHLKEKEELELAVERREVTIKNLEQELEKKDMEVRSLKERIAELEKLIINYRNEINKNNVYRGLLEENIRLKNLNSRLSM
jgi:archaellum component FlaD/FlaE